MEKGMNLTALQEWSVYHKRPFLISGPCSAESEEQMMQTAEGLAALGRVDVFRAGIWKPRTRPAAFEGVGSAGMPWMKKIKETYGLPVGTEVANVKHVYEALKFGVDVLWLGARTTANPFAVQEIADALKGLDVTVLVKNPVSPDVELWMGAVERIYKAGIKEIGVIHRGFSTYEKSMYRNHPQWQIPIDLKRRMPELPIICDPSHISGNTNLIRSVAQKAMDLNFDGLIIESHVNPTKALSDAKQQLTPEQLGELLKGIILRDPTSYDPRFLYNLGELREKIDMFDRQLMDTLEQRMEVAEEIGRFKKQNNITILQSERWGEIIDKNIEIGRTKGLTNEFIEKLFKVIHQESINHQTKVMNEPGNGKRS